MVITSKSLSCFYIAVRIKLGIFSKVKSKIPDFERGKTKILTARIY